MSRARRQRKEAFQQQPELERLLASIPAKEKTIRQLVADLKEDETAKAKDQERDVVSSSVLFPEAYELGRKMAEDRERRFLAMLTENAATAGIQFTVPVQVGGIAEYANINIHPLKWEEPV